MTSIRFFDIPVAERSPVIPLIAFIPSPVEGELRSMVIVNGIVPMAGKTTKAPRQTIAYLHHRFVWSNDRSRKFIYLNLVFIQTLYEAKVRIRH
jgi:hypothetical protein